MTLKAENLSITIGQAQLLKNISLAMKPGKLLGILGPNGAGKSTLLKALSGDLTPSHGRVTLEDVPLHNWSSQDLALRRSVMPQASQLAFPFKVRDVVSMGRWPYEKLCTPFINRLTAEKAMNLTDIRHLSERAYSVLSGGEKQRVQLARALAQNLGIKNETQTKYLLLDEPTAGLDIAHQHGVLSAAQKQCHEKNVGGLAILHDFNQAAQYCDFVGIISNGSLTAIGPTIEVMDPVLLSDIFRCQISVSFTVNSPQPIFHSSI